jgi:tRNA(His) 5'-end guanylyltransferase
MLGQTHFSHKELNKKSCNDIQNMLFTERGVNFNDMPTEFKRGVCCYKVTKSSEVINFYTKEKTEAERSEWEIDTEIPIFTQNPNFIHRWVFI